MISEILPLNWGVRRKYIFMLSVVLLFLGVVLTKNVVIQFQREVLEENLMLKGRKTIFSIAQIAQNGFKQKGRIKGVLKKELDALSKRNLVSYIVVVEFEKGSFKNQHVVFSSGKPVENRSIIAQSLSVGDVVSMKIKYLDVIDLAVPVYRTKEAAGKPVGVVRLGMDYGSIKRRLMKAAVKGGLITLFVLVISSVIFSILINNELLLPLRKITLATVAASHGDLRQEVDINSRNELGILARQFNLMIHDLREWRIKLEQSNYSLEEKVKERIKDLKKLNDELTDTNVQLRELNKVKTNFISMVSHELRTPLTAIKGFISTLLRKDISIDDKTKEKYLVICDKESDRLARLIDDLLNITRIESGRMELFYDKINVEELVGEIFEDSHEKTPKNKFTVNFEESFPRVEADREKIKKVIRNFMDNAIKYSPPKGEISISGRVLEDEIEISVEDHGNGIPEDQLHKVFEKFYRVDDEINRKNPGTGLGLAISKSIIELHGGIIWAESELDKGSRFVFTVPIKGLG